MTGIFISYRQEDAKAWAISLRDEVGRVFGDDQVFLDKDTLHAGNWRDQIEQALGACQVVLVVIGPRWLTIADAQNRPRIQLADDVHRQEVALALGRHDLTVIPILVDDAPMPRQEQLPADLQPLGAQQARKIGDTQERRKADLAVLFRDIQLVGGILPRPNHPARPAVPVPDDQRRVGWLQFNAPVVAIAVGVTLTAGVVAYIAGAPVDEAGLFFLLVVSCAAVSAVKWLWARFQRQRGERR